MRVVTDESVDNLAAYAMSAAACGRTISGLLRPNVWTSALFGPNHLATIKRLVT
jgi:hypothetical protein